MKNEEMPRASLAAHMAVFCAAIGGFMCLYCTQAIYPELRSRFGLTIAEAGTLLTVTTLGLAFAAPFSSRVANRFGPRAAVLGGLAALAGSTFLFGFADHRAALVVLRLTQGLLIPVVLSALLASISALWQGGQAMAMSATFVTGTVIGGLVGRLLPALALASLGWHGTFIVFALVEIVLLLVVWFIFPRAEAQTRTETSVGVWLSKLLPTLSKPLVAVSAAGFCLLFTQTAVTTYIAIRLASAPYRWSTEALGALYAVFVPALVFVRLTPKAVARLGSSATFAFVVALAWLGLGLTLLAPVSAILVGLVMFSVAVFVGQAVLAHMVGTTSTQNKEVAAGIYLCFYYLGGSAGALAPALLWSQWGWAGCLALVMLVQCAGLMIVRGAQHGR